MPREIKDSEEYKNKLLKLIPSEIVAAYLVLQGMIPKDSKWATLIISIILLGLCPAYLVKVHRVRCISQLIITPVSFIVWVYSIGGAFQVWGLHQPWIGSVALVLWTLAVPLVPKPQPKPANP